MPEATDAIVEMLLQYGMAGLMAALWVWERAQSRRRDQELSASHDRLMQRDEQLGALLRTVEKNTTALVEFERTQRYLGDVLEGIRHAITDRHREA